MSTHNDTEQAGELAAGDESDSDSGASAGVRSYVLGFILSVLLTAASFGVVGSSLIWGPGIPVALAVFAVAQMGVHLVFFLHINTSPDNTNNLLALAFGVLIVAIVISGSLWIMYHLNHNMMQMNTTTNLQQQR